VVDDDVALGQPFDGPGGIVEVDRPMPARRSGAGGVRIA
jgi:hypothetical protein